MERCIVANSSSLIKEEACSQVISQLKSQSESPKLIVFFSDQNDFWYYAQSLKENFPDSISIGTVTNILFNSQEISKPGLSAMAVYYGIECSAGMIYEIHRHPDNYHSHIRNALKKLTSTENTCCLEFTSSFVNGEELVQDTFSKELAGKNIPVAGGSSSGSKPGSETAYVALNGVIYKDTCVFVFIHNLEGKILVSREDIFKPTNNILQVTDVDCEDHRVYEYNGVPAKNVMEEILGTTYEENPSKFFDSPMGRMLGNDIYMTQFAGINTDLSINYHSRIYNQTRMVVMEKDNYDEVWNRTKEHVLSKIKKPSFSFCVQSYSRTIMLQTENRFDDFVNVLKDNYGKFIGTSTLGEQINFINANQTMLLIAFE